ncbi:hypothetical protein CR513_11164, partial [Mucuna pruriens]
MCFLLTVPVAQRNRSQMPRSSSEVVFIMIRVNRFQLIEAVRDHAVALQLRLVSLFQKLGEDLVVLWRLWQLHLRQGYIAREIRNHEGLGVRGNLVLRLVLSHARQHAQGEESQPVEHNPRNPQLGGGVGRPRVEHVGHYAVRVFLLQQMLQWVPQKHGGFQERDDPVRGERRVGILATFGQAGFLRRWEFDGSDVDAGFSDDSGQVNAGYDVTIRREGEEEYVKLTILATHVQRNDSGFRLMIIWLRGLVLVIKGTITGYGGSRVLHG